DEFTFRLLLKRPLIIGVRNVNCWLTLTVIVLPGPVPPVASEQAMAAPPESAHVALTLTAPSPRWPWPFVSWRAFVAIPLAARHGVPPQSAGEAAPEAAPS